MARILTLTSWYPPHHFGGYELSCYDVMTRLVARGHDVRVLCGDERVPGAEASDHEGRVFRELRPHLREAARGRPPLRDRIAIERADHRVLAEHLATFRPDVVSVWHMVAIPASLLQLLTASGVPVVYVVCDNWPVYTARTDPWISQFRGGPLRALAGRAVERGLRMPTTAGRFTDRGTFCFVSEATRRAVVAHAPWSYPVSTVVYSGIETAAFRDETGAPASRGAGTGPTLLYVGRLDAWKGVDTLLRALAFLPPAVNLQCFGRGADHERVRLATLARSLGVADRVTFGSCEREELAAHYRAADLVVFPSEWPEPFGLVPLEAMACGTPVVASRVGGSAEFLRDGENCVGFAAGDARALAAAVCRVLGDRDLRGAIVCGGRATASAFDVEHLADALEQWHVGAAARFAFGRPADRADWLAAAGVTVRAGAPGACADGAGDDRAAVIARLLARTRGLVLDAASGFGSAIVGGGGGAAVVAVRDRGDGPNAASGVPTVLARADALPFRAASFAAAVTSDRLGDTTELARIVQTGGRVLVAVANPQDASHAPARLAERVRLGRRSADLPSPVASPRPVPAAVERGLAPEFRVVARHPVAWNGGRKRALASRVARWKPLRRYGPAVVVEALRTPPERLTP